MALVTGARATRAIVLARADAGAAVIVNARTSRRWRRRGRDRGAWRPALAHLADVTDEAGVAAMVSTGVKHFGRLDILVNNAAVRDATSLDRSISRPGAT